MLIPILAAAGIPAVFGAPAGAHPDPGDRHVHDGELDGQPETPFMYPSAD